MLNQEEIESQYKRYLDFSYGCKATLIVSMNKAIARYKSCANSSHPKCVERIHLYTEIVRLAEKS